MSTASARAIAVGDALKQARAEAAAKALVKLRDETIPSLESVIAGTPTSTRRDQLTQANIILHNILIDSQS
jgi:hypothetical protein